MTNMKRSASDSESDDGFDDLKDGSPSQSCHTPDRKRRRGIIEKRRRDRINSSLSELRRLVPAAFEKQGSAKLEKAEILQMTVDHLKILHTKAGLGGYNFDTAALALDYRSVGFRECAAEVARYLVTVEGMDIQDPLRLRLLSHLQCYSAQREAAAKTGFNGAWGHPPQYGASGAHAQSLLPAPPPPPSQQQQQQSVGQTADLGYETRALTHHPLGHHHHHHHHHQSPIDGGHIGSASMRITGGGSASSASGNTSAPQSATSGSAPMVSSVLAGLPQIHTQFPPVSLNVNSIQMLSPSSGHNYNFAMSGPLAQSASSSVKPYRPWGTELVY